MTAKTMSASRAIGWRAQMVTAIWAACAGGEPYAEAALAKLGEAVAVAVGQNVRLAILSAMPDGADRVEDEARGKAEAFGDAHFPRRAGGERAASLFQRGPGGIMDRAIHPATAHQAGIGRIDDHVRLNVEQATGIENETGHQRSLRFAVWFRRMEETYQRGAVLHRQGIGLLPKWTHEWRLLALFGHCEISRN